MQTAANLIDERSYLPWQQDLKELYVSTVAPALMKKFSYKSVMQIPKIDKVVINVGAGEAKDNSKVIDAIMN